MFRVWVIGASLVCLCCATARAQGQWFDIGDGTATTIKSTSDPATTIYYPPFPFGEYPPGTLVYSEVEKVAPGRFAAVYLAYFDDGGCGCTGQPAFGVIYTIHYDDAALGWPEAETKLYARDTGNWVELVTAVLDTSKNTLTIVSQTVASNVYFGVGVPAILPVDHITWGAVKEIFRDP